jgi:hypothetical protein
MSGILSKLHRNDVFERDINSLNVELLRDKSHWLPEANGFRQWLLEVIGLSQRLLEANGFHAPVGEAKLKNTRFIIIRSSSSKVLLKAFHL